MLKTINIAVLGPSEIALRRFMPALVKIDNVEFYGVAVATDEEKVEVFDDTVSENDKQKSVDKAHKFLNFSGGKVLDSYSEALENEEVDAVYIPLPPALHYHWAKKALLNGKHVFLEKPFTTSLEHTKELLNIAKEKKLAVFENYAFIYHQQIEVIRNLVSEGKIGELRQIRTAFGFPYRGADDFRYSKKLGGGSLFDCGGYPTKLSAILLGESSRVVAASLSNGESHDVDIFGSITMTGNTNITSQISFGMDHYYKCELELWGSKGTIYAPRIFTAPPDYSVEIILQGEEKKVITVPEDNQFMKAIMQFYDAVEQDSHREKHYNSITKQSMHIDNVFRTNLKKGDFDNG